MSKQERRSWRAAACALAGTALCLGGIYAMIAGNERIGGGLVLGGAVLVGAAVWMNA